MLCSDDNLLSMRQVVSRGIMQHPKYQSFLAARTRHCTKMQVVELVDADVEGVARVERDDAWQSISGCDPAMRTH